MTEEKEERPFEPGAAKYGNFINYYSFNTITERIDLFPIEFWSLESGKDLVCMDVGCNSGDLTEVLQINLSSQTSTDSPFLLNRKRKCYILGLDIDPILIARAKIQNKTDDIVYECLDVLKAGELTKCTNNFLNKLNRTCFDVVFIFSITMWIHLNNGDNGLKTFLRNISKLTNAIILEAQPWKCYKSAIRRLKRLKTDIYSEWNKLTMRDTVEEDIDNILCSDCGFNKIFETNCTGWGRKIKLFKKNINSA